MSATSGTGLDDVHPTVLSSLHDLRRALALYAVVPLLLAALLGALAGFRASGQPGASTATGRVLLSSEGRFDPLGGYAQPDADRFLQTQADALRTPALLQAALTAAKDPRGPEEVGADLVVTPALGADILTLTLTDTDGPRAARVVDRLTAQYQALRRDEVADIAAAAVARARGDETRIVDIETRAVVYGTGVQLVEAAVVAPPAATARRDMALGALLGLLLGVAVVALGVRLATRRQRAAQRLERVLGGPCLGSFPVLEGGIQDAVTPADRACAGEVSRLAVTTTLAAGHVGARRLLVAAPVKDAGATTVTANLALGAALQGAEVVVLAAPGRGRPADSQLRDLPAAVLSPFWGRDDLSAGLGTRLAVRTLSRHDRTLETADPTGPLVLVDPGAALDDARCLRLCAHVDAVVLVCSPRQAPESLVDLRRLLDLAHVPLLGFVLNRGARRRSPRAQPRHRPLRVTQERPGRSAVLDGAERAAP